jgi:hypothetical protein
MAAIQSVCAWWVFEKGVCDFLQRVVFITRRMNRSEVYMGNPYNVCRTQKYRDCVAAMLSSARVDSSMLYVLRGQPAWPAEQTGGKVAKAIHHAQIQVIMGQSSNTDSFSSLPQSSVSPC